MLSYQHRLYLFTAPYHFEMCKNFFLHILIMVFCLFPLSGWHFDNDIVLDGMAFDSITHINFLSIVNVLELNRGSYSFIFVCHSVGVLFPISICWKSVGFESVCVEVLAYRLITESFWNIATYHFINRNCFHQCN